MVSRAAIARSGWEARIRLGAVVASYRDVEGPVTSCRMETGPDQPQAKILRGL
jgi:hypothetical protein